jgi:tetratricopeptide (TPR) repeat protein
MPKELSPALHEKITRLAEQGDQYIEDDDYDKAVEVYQQAIRLLPSPITEWEAATWLYSGIGDAYYFADNNEKSHDAFQQALKSPGGLGNPFIYLRLGQTAFDMGKNELAKDYLMRAYMLDGNTIFEDTNPKYFDFIKPYIEIDKP